jgi:hypothetical protein
LCGRQPGGPDGGQQSGEGADDDGLGQPADPGSEGNDDRLAVGAGVDGGGSHPGQAMFVVPEPAELAERARAVVEAAGWFEGRACDLGIALGEDPEYGPHIPDWLLNLVLDLGRAGLADEAASVAEALGRVGPELQPVSDADLGVALAAAGRSDDARAQIAANLAAWPEDFWVRIHSGDALEVLGDPG